MGNRADRHKRDRGSRLKGVILARFFDDWQMVRS